RLQSTALTFNGGPKFLDTRHQERDLDGRVLSDFWRLRDVHGLASGGIHLDYGNFDGSASQEDEDRAFVLTAQAKGLLVERGKSLGVLGVDDGRDWPARMRVSIHHQPSIHKEATRAPLFSNG